MDDFDQDTKGTVNDLFVAVLFKAIAIILIAYVMLLPFVKSLQTAAKQDDALNPDSITVEAVWGENLPVDIDLWTKGAGDKQPVGYSAKNGRQFNLLRDDIGQANDATPINYEIASGRGLYEGEYIVNLHLYAAPGGDVPLEVTVVVTLTINGNRNRIFVEKVTLAKIGEETTVIRFRLDKDGRLVPGSESYIPYMLRTKP